MRVIAGKYKSRVLKSLRGQALRPTSDRLRETLFNILGGDVEDCLFVDLYAGTGAVGIEALSRGAREVVFIEKYAAAVQLIRKNLRALGVMEGFQILKNDAIRGLDLLEHSERGHRAQLLGTGTPPKGTGVTQIFFLDPPYAKVEEYERVLEFLDRSPLLTAESCVIAEHPKRHDLPARIDRLIRMRVVTQGDAALSFYLLKE